MSAYVTINVTQEHIDKARRNHSGRCAVAMAVKQAVSDAKRPEADIQTIRWTSAGGERVVYPTPGPVMDYIIDFDGGRALQPFSFRLWASHKATIPSVHRNPAFKKVDAASTAARKAAAKKQSVSTSALATPAQKKAAAKKAASTSKALVDAKKTHGPQARTTYVKGDATHYKIPTHPKSRSMNRVYGIKALLINQDQEKLEQELAQTKQDLAKAKAAAKRTSAKRAAARAR